MEEQDAKAQQQSGNSFAIGVYAHKLASSIEAATLLTAVSFSVGIAYFQAYYSRLGVPHLAQKIDTPTVLITSILPVLVYASAMYWSLKNSTKKPDSILEAFRGNFFVIVFCFGYGFWLHNQFGLQLSIVGAGSLLILYVLLSFFKWSLSHMWSKSSSWKAVIVLIGWSGGIMTANAFGDLHGTNLVRGMPGSTSIKLTLKDASAILPSQEQELIFVALSDGQYYFLERAESPSVNPRIYAVSSDEVKSIELNGRRLR